MARQAGQLDQAAEELAACARGVDDRVAERAGRLAERLGRGRFHISVLGEFKRGKSTFLDALVGTAVLPTGALPVTAVTTEVGYGPPGAAVVYLDGTRRELREGEEIADYVTESKNPSNVARVARVEVCVETGLLESGLVLVDTPGVASIHRHNDQVAAEAMEEGDGAIVVLSADAPLSERERALVATLGSRRIPCFFVLNKVDHLDAPDLAQVRRFVLEALEAELGTPVRLWCLAALPALRARQAGASPGPASGEFMAFESELRHFVEVDLAPARASSARRELERLADELSAVLEVSAASLAMSSAVLAERVQAFREAADLERRAMADDRTLLDKDVAVLSSRLAVNLAGFARQAPARWTAELERVAAGTALSRLDEDLRAAVEKAVKEDFESFRREEEGFAEEAWREMAARQRARIDKRVNDLRAAAADLFAVELPPVRVPEVSEEREGFFYLFVHVGTSTEVFGRLAGRILPGRLVRARALVRAKGLLAVEFDKHAGRAAWDLRQRLDAVRRRFEADMAGEVERSVETILQAAARAQDLRDQADDQRRRRAADDAAARRVVGAVLALAREATAEGHSAPEPS